MCREVIGNYMDLLVARLIGHQIGKERDGLGRGVAGARFCPDLASLVLKAAYNECAVTIVCKAIASARPGASGSTGSANQRLNGIMHDYIGATPIAERKNGEARCWRIAFIFPRHLSPKVPRWVCRAILEKVCGCGFSVAYSF